MQLLSLLPDDEDLGGKRKLEAVSVYLTPELKQVLEEWAAEESRSLSRHIVHLLAQAVKEKGQSMNEPIERLQEQAQKSRQKSREQRLIKEQLQDSEEVFWATYEGYEADSGHYRVIKADGSVILVKGSLPGGVGTGDMVVVRQAKAGYASFVV